MKARFFHFLILTAAWPALSQAGPAIYTLTTGWSGIGNSSAGTIVDLQFSVPAILTTQQRSPAASVQVPYAGSFAGYASAVLVSFAAAGGSGNPVQGVAPVLDDAITSPGNYISYSRSSGTQVGALTISPEPSTFAMPLVPLAWLGVRQLRRRAGSASVFFKEGFSPMRACSCFLLMLTAACTATSADGASLYLSGYAQTDYGTINAPGSYVATASTVITGSQTTPAAGAYGPNRDSSSSYTAYLSLGDLGLSASVSAYNSNSPYNGTESAGANFTAGMTDALTITGISSGLLALNFSVDGTISHVGGTNTGGSDVFSAEYLLATSVGGVGNSVVATGTVQNGVGTPSSTTLNGSTMNFSFTPDPNIANLWDYVATGTALIPFTSGTVYLESYLLIGGGCNSDFGPCSATADFLHTALIGGAMVEDPQGNVIQGATISSASDYDYTQPLHETNTPEPATFGLMGSSLVALAMLRKKAAKHAETGCCAGPARLTRLAAWSGS